MGTVWTDVLVQQIHNRKHRLEAAMARNGESARLAALLQEIDSTLERVGAGTFGLCQECHTPIEADRLLADPTVSTCLECLSEHDRRALESDLDLAARIQSRLLPQPSRSYDGWEVCYSFRPAGAVSGDYCDVIADPEGLMFLTGDVSGKGVAASLLMSQLHAIFRSLSPYSMAVSELVSRANRVFCESTLSTHYATLVCGCTCPSGEMTVCNAGHCPPLLLHRDSVETIESNALPLGLFCDTEYECQSLQVEPGDTLVLYTDGVSEAENERDEEYGVDRLRAVLDANRNRSTGDLLAAALRNLEQFRGGARQRDDQTLMLIRRG